MNKKLTGFILAGGKSSRMGTDKGLLPVDGEAMVQKIALAMNPVVDKIIIISNGNNYNYLGHKVYEDLIKDCGPLGGIYTALMKSDTDQNLIVSCDMPFLRVELFNLLIKSISSDHEIIIPQFNDQPEPLCAIYNKSCAPKMYDLLIKKEFKLKEVLKQFKLGVIDINVHAELEDCFTNVNTPVDYQNVKFNKGEYSN